MKKTEAGQTRIIRFRDVHLFASNRNKIEDAILNRRDYDRDNLDLLETMCHAGLTGFDVGANIGIYSLIMSRHFGAEGAVHAFEPVPHIRAKLEANLRLNGLRNVRVNDCALGEKAGTATINAIAPGHYRAGTSSLVENENLARVGRQHFTKLEIAVTSLDTYVAQHGIARVDVVKIDVEGYELFVLQGAERTLKDHRPLILMEHNQRRLQAIDVPESAFRDLFEAAGYVCCEFASERGTVLLDRFRFDRKLRRNNLLCMPAEFAA